MADQDDEIVSLLESSEDMVGIEIQPLETQPLSDPQPGWGEIGGGSSGMGMKKSSNSGRKILLCLLAATLALVVSCVYRKYPRPRGTHPKNFTFPSVEERVHYYMSNWYDIPPDYMTGLNKSSSVCADMKVCKPDLGNNSLPEPLETNGTLCQYDVPWISSEQSVSNFQIQEYIEDSLLLFQHLETKQRMNEPRIVIMQGDLLLQNPKHPIITKARYTKDAQPNQPVTSQTIIGYLETERHYHHVRKTVNYFAWHEKLETLIFRGGDNNQKKRAAVVQKYNRIGEYSLQDIDMALAGRNNTPKKELTYDRTKYRPLFRDFKSRQQLLEYKYFLVMEGNDVASGLKWMLFSNSVVFMSKPTRVSWAMEDLLVPFVHYVPVEDDYSDLLEKVEWARAHDEECQLISQQATQYMYDLHMSRQAKKDREEILRQIAQRYYTNYSPILSVC